MSHIATLRSVLGAQTNDKSVHAEALLNIIREAPKDDRAELLSTALVERDTVAKEPKALPNKGIEQNRWDALARTHAELIDGHLKMAFFKTRTANEFSSEILRFIDFLPDLDEKAFALAKTLFSPYVPYRELPGVPVHMSNAEYRHKLESDEERVTLVDYIIALPFDERTERASMLLQVIDDTDDRDMRVALLAHADAAREKSITQRIVARINR